MQASVRLGQRERDPLVLADRAAEHDAVVGVGDGASEGDLADAEGLGGDEDALRVEAVEQVPEALALLPDAIRDRDRQVVVAHLARHDGVAPQLVAIGRISTSGLCRSASSSVRPSVRLRHWSIGVVRTSSSTFWQYGAFVVHTLRPRTT